MQLKQCIPLTSSKTREKAAMFYLPIPVSFWGGGVEGVLFFISF